MVSKLEVAVTGWPSTVKVNAPSARVAALRSTLKTAAETLVCVLKSLKSTVVSVGNMVLNSQLFVSS